MANSFRFKRFEVRNEDSPLKVGTDAVLLGAAMTVLDRDEKLLDIGTGTGVIALMAAQRLSELRDDFMIDAIEIDGPSAQEAGLNFDSSPWKDHLTIHNADLKDFVPRYGYDLVFSNPPFYDDSLLNPDGRESRARHTLSLSYRDICGFCCTSLNEGGRLSIILPADKETALVRTAASFGLFPFRIIRIRTSEGKPARRLIAEFSWSRVPPAFEELVLQKGAERTDAYRGLTKDFYLDTKPIVHGSGN